MRSSSRGGDADPAVVAKRVCGSRQGEGAPCCVDADIVALWGARCFVCAVCVRAYARPVRGLLFRVSCCGPDERECPCASASLVRIGIFAANRVRFLLYGNHSHCRMFAVS